MRRRDVDRLFEERAVERIGLVEDRKRRGARRRSARLRSRTRVPAMKPSTRIVSSRPLANRAHVLARQQRANARDSALELRRRVGAHHAAAARETERLDDAGERDARIAGARGCRLARLRRTTAPADPRAANAARALLVDARSRGLRRVATAARAPAAARAASTTGRSPTAITPSIGLRCARRRRSRAASSSSSWKRTAIAASRHGIVEMMAAIGREHQLDPQRARPRRRTSASDSRSWWRRSRLAFNHLSLIAHH